MLAETICKAQKGDEKSTLELLTLFNRLMTRYAYLLEYEDAINDLTLDFIALLKQISYLLRLPVVLMFQSWFHFFPEHS